MDTLGGAHRSRHRPASGGIRGSGSGSGTGSAGTPRGSGAHGLKRASSLLASLNSMATNTAQPAVQETPHLRRVLGTWDLTWLCVVAITNMNLVPVVAAGGFITVWLWLLALAFFFWPQGVAVIELSHRFPGEGGIYLWAKALF